MLLWNVFEGFFHSDFHEHFSKDSFTVISHERFSKDSHPVFL